MVARPQEKAEVKHPYVQAILPLDKIVCELQVRRDIPSEAGQAALAELTESIRGHGILQPALVSPIEGTDTYKLIAGHRRYLAAQRAGHEYMPVLITHAEGAEAVILQVLENVQREALNPVDEGRAYLQIMDRFNITGHALARALGKSTGYVRSRIKVAADAFWAQAVVDGKVSSSVASLVLGLKDEEREEFRRRVERGERVQYTDYIARVTQRVDNNEGPNPRYSSGRPEAGAHSPSRAGNIYHARDIKAAMGRLEGSVIARQDAPDQPVYLVPASPETSVEQQPAERHRVTLHDLIDALPQAALVRLLSRAAEQGMSCVQLLEEVRAHD